MVRPGRDRLTGVRMDVDETYLGGLEEGVRGRQTERKALIIVCGSRRRTGHRSYSGAANRRRFSGALDGVCPGFGGSGSVVHTDGWLGYEPLAGKCYDHEVTFLKRKKDTPSELMPRVHRVISLLYRWLMGPH
jgi:hypothetical protein